MSDPIDLSTLSADDITRVSSFYPLGIVAAIASDQAALVTGGATTADLTKLHAITASAAEASVLHSSGITNADLIKVHAVTATAAELSKTAGVTAGAVSASKALVVDATSNLDALAITALSLGAAGGTAVTSTAAELNALHSQGAVTTDFAKLHAVTASAAEISQLAAQGAITTDFAKLHAITAAAATLNQVAAATGTVTFDRSIKVAKVALGALDTGGGVFAWANPEAGSIIITKVVLDVTTVSTGACTVDVGTTAANATTLSDNLIDGVDTHSAVITTDNVTDAGSAGKSVQKLASGKWVTGSMASGGAAGTAGFAYISYLNI